MRWPARKPMYGSAENNALKVGKKTHELFVFILDTETTKDHFSSYLSNVVICIIEIDCRSNDDATCINKVFRITLDYRDINTVM